MLEVVQKFDKESVRIEGTPDEPLFNAADCCRALMIESPRNAYSRIPGNQKAVRTTDTPGGPQESVWLTEGGLYSLIFQSRKPAAERFRLWVTDEVLPSIRRHGSYLAPGATATTVNLPDNFTAALSDAIGHHLCETNGHIHRVESKVDALDAKVSRFVRRRMPSQGTRDEAIRATVRWNGGRCWCCGTAQIVASDGIPDGLEMDHWFCPSRNRAFEVWPVCGDCNKRLHNAPQFKRESEPLFRAYQRRREQMQPRLFRVE